MLDFDKQLENIIKKYNIFSDITLKEYSSVEVVINNWKSIPDNARVAIWGAGYHTEKLFEIVSGYKKNLICLIDKNSSLQGEIIYELPVLSPKNLINLKIDIVVISSYDFRDEIANELNTLYKECRIIDLYSSKTANGINICIKGPFYIFDKKKSKINQYYDILNLRLIYENTKYLELKERYLFAIVAKYLEYRDFVYAIKYIEEYINMNFIKKEALICFLKELIDLLNKLKNQLLLRKKEDIIIFIIDSLRQIDVFQNEYDVINMPYLKKLSENSLAFTNAFSNSTYTRGSIIAMFEDKTNDVKQFFRPQYNIDWEKSSLLDNIINQGYKIINHTRFTVLPDNKNIQNISYDKIFNISKYWWKALCQLAKESNDVPVLSILHCFEVHNRTMGLFHERYPRDVYQETLQYIDKQMEFYMSFLHPNTIKIVTADHGNTIDRKKMVKNAILPWYEEAIHVPFIVNTKCCSHNIYNKLFSMKRFSVQVLNILIKREILDERYFFIEILRDPVYNLEHFDLKEKYLNQQENKFLKAFKVIRGEYDKYVMYHDDTEEYYILPNETTNLIHEEKYAKRIKQMKENFGSTDFLDYYKSIEKNRNQVKLNK